MNVYVAGGADISAVVVGAAAGPAQAELRRVTADIHVSLHRHPAFARLMRGSLSLAEYSSLLASLHGFHLPLERALRAGPACLEGQIDLAAREKAPLLRADLAALGMSDAELDVLPQCVELPDLHSRNAIFGSLYVVEGAGLGGRVMAGKLDHLLRRESPAGRRFFLGRKNPDPLPWPVFCQLLELRAREGDLAEIAASARQTFEAIERWLRVAIGDV